MKHIGNVCLPIIHLCQEHSVQVESSHFTSIIDGLQKLYTEKLRPLEVAYQFNEFGFPPLVHTHHTQYNTPVFSSLTNLIYLCFGTMSISVTDSASFASLCKGL